jgi:hypothetical protein
MHALKHTPVFTECRQLKGGRNPRLLWQNEDEAFDPGGDFSAITAPVFGVVPLAVGSALKLLTGSNATLRIGMRPSVLVRRGVGCGTASFSGRSYFLLH